MAKSTIKLPNGTVITVEGTTSEVSRVLGGYVSKERPATGKKPASGAKSSGDTGGSVNILELVNAAKNADDFEQIEKKILDGASQVDRVLLPLFLSEREFEGVHKLTSNDIYKFLKEFGVNMALPNISRTLSGTAQKYVMGDKTRKKGLPRDTRFPDQVENILNKFLLNEYGWAKAISAATG